MSERVSAPAASLWPADPATAELPGLHAIPALTSWRPNAHLSAVERYGRFEILGRIGRGGMAEILLARECSFAGTLRHLVVKRMLPENVGSNEMLQMFLAEARVVMGLSHPNLCQIYEVGEQDGTWFIAMEWVNGVTLHQLLRRAYDRKHVDYAVLARVLAQCAEALHHAHTARDAAGRPLRLVHRDVSPHNLMVGYDGRVKLLDFGIAKSTANTHRTETGIVKGKVCYMAPEQWRSEALDGRADVFGLGACLYEVLTGQIAFRRDTQGEVMRAICEEPVPRITELMEGVPEELSEIAHRALAKDPDDRFSTALEMSEALERFAGDRIDPINSARIADYTRRLFSSEVALGPMLERAMRGAALQRPPMLPPLAPAALRGLGGAIYGASERPLSLPRLLGNAPLPAPPAMPVPTEAVGTPSGPPSREYRMLDTEALLEVDDGTEVDYVIASQVQGPSELDALSGRLHHVVASPFSEAPTRPVRGISGEIVAHIPSVPPRQTGASRAEARTQSMQVVLGLRKRVALAVAATLVGGFVGMAAYDSVGRWMVPKPQNTTMLVGAASTSQVDGEDADARRVGEPIEPEAPHARPLLVEGLALSEKPSQVQVGPLLEQVQVGPLLEAVQAGQAVESHATQAELHTAKREAPRAREAGKTSASEGHLSINTRPWSTVYLGRRVLGTTPLSDVVVPRGPLTLKLVDRHGAVHTRYVARTKQQRRSVFFDLSVKKKSR